MDGIINIHSVLYIYKKIALKLAFKYYIFCNNQSLTDIYLTTLNTQHHQEL